jgi:hypothetical protein
MENAAAHCCPRKRVELAKIARNKLTADRSTTELRWIKFFGRTVGIQFAHRIASGKCFQIFDIDLVAGAGFEPAVPQTRDYEPDRGRSIIL